MKLPYIFVRARMGNFFGVHQITRRKLMSENKNRVPSEAHTTVKTILVVEDDRSMASFFVEAIKQETSHQALFAFDGHHALKLLFDLKPDLLLLDYNLPRMNGLDLYDHIHSIKELAHIPALLISARPPLEEVKKRNLT